MNARQRWLISLILAMLLFKLTGLAERPKLEKPNYDDPEIKDLYAHCNRVPGCKIIQRRWQMLLETKEYQSEVVILMQTSAVIEPHIERWRSSKGLDYILIMFPNSIVDSGMVAFFKGGK